MSAAHVVSLLGIMVTAVGGIAGTTWLWASGLTATIAYAVVGETPDDGLRGCLSAFAIPVILTVAILTGS